MSRVSNSESEKKELAKNKTEAALYRGDGGNLHITNPIINISSVINEPSTSGSQTPKTKSETSQLDEGCVQICSDIFMYNKTPLKRGTNVFKGYQEHLSGPRVPLAIKRISPYDDKNLREVGHLASLASHPNIVQIIRSETCEGKVPELYIAMELCSSKTLQDYLKENCEKNTPFDFDQTMTFTKQLVSGIKHIHQNKIAHRDLKPENILISLNGGQIKVSDFGISKEIRDGNATKQTTSLGEGTDGYRAPETFKSKDISKSADIFSLGLVLYPMWSNGKHAFGMDVYKRNSNIIDNKGRDLSGLLISGTEANQLRNLFDWMLQPDPKKRPTIEQVDEHTFFKSGPSPTAEDPSNNASSSQQRGMKPSLRKPTNEDSLIEQPRSIVHHPSATNIPPATPELPEKAPPEVERAPEFVSKFEVYTSATEGDTVTLECQVRGSPEPEITWTIDRKAVKGGNDAFENGRAILTISSVNPDHVGNVVCVAKNSAGQSKHEGRLYVRGKREAPSFVTELPTEVEVVEGDEVTFGCQVKGHSQPRVTWTRNGRSLSVLNTETSYEEGKASVRIRKAGNSDGGKYVCTAGNLSGESDTSCVVSVLPKQEMPKPSFIRQLEDMQIEENRDIRLECEVAKVPKVEIIWMLDGQKLEAEDGESSFKDGIARMVLVDATTEDSGLYECTAKARSGEAKTSCNVVVTETRLQSDSAAISSGITVRKVRGSATFDTQKTRTNLADMRKNLQGYDVRVQRFTRDFRFGKEWEGRFSDQKVTIMQFNEDDVEKYENAVDVLTDLEHENIVQFIKEIPEICVILTEFCECGTLKEYLACGGKRAELSDLFRMAAQIALGMDFLHQKKFVHCDLRAANVAVTANLLCKVSGFGMSRHVGMRGVSSVGETNILARWAAQEVFEKGYVSFESDVWSFGVVLWEIVTRGAEPYPGLDEVWMDKYFHYFGSTLRRGHRMLKPKQCPSGLYFDIMMPCWDKDPNARPTFKCLQKSLLSYDVEADQKEESVTVRALRDYTAVREGALSFKKGDIIVDCTPNSNGACSRGTLDGKTGIFSTNLVVQIKTHEA